MPFSDSSAVEHTMNYTLYLLRSKIVFYFFLTMSLSAFQQSVATTAGILQRHVLRKERKEGCMSLKQLEDHDAVKEGRMSLKQLEDHDAVNLSETKCVCLQVLQGRCSR